MNKKTKNILINLIAIFVVFIIFASSIINIVNSNIKIKKFINKFFKDKDNPSYSKTFSGNENLAHDILEGKYILHFRHAEREKWLDVQVYDAIETELTNGKDYNFAENQYLEKAVCLNSKGKVQARAMSEVLKKVNLKYSKVISSPSCRARQTAIIAFGGYNEINKILVHRGPYNENSDRHLENIKKFYISLKPKNNNLIISSHGNVIHGDIFDNFNGPIHLEEGGFAVIEVKNEKLYLKGVFENFKHFQIYFYNR